MFDLVGMGNAIVDLTTQAVDNPAFLNMKAGNKGGFFYTRSDEFEEILHFSKNHHLSAGGSVANSLKAFAALGGTSCFIGKIGMDRFGTYFVDQLKIYGVTSGLAIDKEQATGCSVVLVHPDGEKSICAKRRASKIIKPKDINMELVSEAKSLLIEGYWLDENLLTVKKIINSARQNMIRIIFTLSDPQIVRQNLNFFSSYLKKIDILIGNEKEFEALGGLTAQFCVKTRGADGVDLFCRGRWVHFDSEKIDKPLVNTSGAGDAFAGGFLWGMSQGFEPEKAVEIGQKCAADVITRMDPNVAIDLNKRITL